MFVITYQQIHYTFNAKQQVSSDKKLPILYLIDSIMKNVAEKGNYKEHFLHNITSVFITVFDKVRK